ncbi:MAG TPA: hypothetical protein VFW89_04160 [Gemmatimonadaceae bacterium]|nr:hypothetical protein [Gemmatimonadaceae bacterium]
MKLRGFRIPGPRHAGGDAIILVSRGTLNELNAVRAVSPGSSHDSIIHDALVALMMVSMQHAEGTR